MRETVTQTRKDKGKGKTLGIRITLDEKTDTGLDADEVIKICSALEEDDVLDYFSVISGSSSSPAGWIHVFRSEEHTSELQSRRNLVCRLLLDKKSFPLLAGLCSR